MATIASKVKDIRNKVVNAQNNEKQMLKYYDTIITIKMLDVTIELPFEAESYNQITDGIENFVKNIEDMPQPLEIKSTLLYFMQNNVGKEQLCMVCDEHGELVTTIIKDINHRYEKNLPQHVLNMKVTNASFDNYAVNGHCDNCIEALFIFVKEV